MREVTKDEFFKAIEGKNVRPRILPGPYPYTSSWEHPDGRVWGRTEDYIPEGKALPKTRYLLT